MKRLISVLLLVSVFLIALGFNTVDAMMWSFYYEPWLKWFPYEWYLTPTFRVEVWNAYFWFGVLPLIAGSMVLGYCIGKL